MKHVPIVEATHLTKYYKNKSALIDVSLTLPKGGVYGVVGRNGAGKSTLFKLLLGLLAPQKGHCKILGEDSQNLSPHTRGRIAYVNDSHALPAWMTVDQIYAFQKQFYPDWNDRVYVQALSPHQLDPKRKISQLSRGERAGLCLALALAQNPDLMLLDEPTLSVDVVGKKVFLDALMNSVDLDEMTVLYCSHNMMDISRYADKLVLLNQGRLVNFSDPESLTERVSRWVAYFPKHLALNHLDGLLTVREIEGNHHITVIDGGRDFPQILKERGATQVSPSPINFEDAVDAFLTHNPEDLRGAA